ncbi:MAG: DUF4831 family protein, partial [Bacteroidales bacterium]
MKRNTTVFLLIGFLISAFPVFAQVNVYHVNASAQAPARDGVFYTLPRTVLKIDVVVKAEEKIKGPLSDYAAQYLGLENVVNFDYTDYFIEEVLISTLTEPDPSQLYYIEAGERGSKDFKTLNVGLEEHGYLTYVNNLDNELQTDRVAEQPVVVIKTPDGREFSEFMLNGMIDKKQDTIIRRVTVDTSLTEQFFFRTRVVEKGTEELALETVEKIEQLRESRYKLLTGFQETAYEAGTITYMDQQLKQLEKQYLDLFRGKTVTDFSVYTFYYTPENADDAGDVLFRFSGSAGIVKGRGGSGEEVTLKIQSLGHGQEASGFSSPKNNDQPYK